MKRTSLVSLACTLLTTGTAWSQGFTSVTSPIQAPGTAGVVAAGVPLAAGPTGARAMTASTGRVILSSPKIADIDADGTDDIVLMAGGPAGSAYSDGLLYVYNGAGSVLPGFPVTLNGASFNTPAIGDIDGNGDLEIVVGNWNNLYVFNHDGLAYPGWPLALYVTNTAVLEDLDGDGDLEIVIPSSNQMRVYHHNGTGYAGFPVSTTNDLTSAGVGDVDGDGDLEIVAGTYFPSGSAIDYVHAWHHDGTVLAGFPATTGGSVKAPPTLADLDGDGTLEVIATCWSQTGTDFIYVWDHTGTTEAGWPLNLAYIRLCSPSVADLDLDGDLEVVFGGWSSPPYSEEIHAYHHTGTSVTGFPVNLGNSPSGNLNSTPTTADIDGDAYPEIVVKAVNNIYVLNHDGSIASGFPYFLDDQSHSGTTGPTPALGDPDGDGLIEIVAAACYDTLTTIDQVGAASAGASSWPTYRNGPRNTGTWVQPGGGFAAHCYGDGTSGACPCGNTASAEEGCLNSTGVGAVLQASGGPSVSHDTLVVTVSQATPTDFGIFLQNLLSGPGAPFYDGLLCLPADGHLVRHYAPPAIQPTVTNASGVGSNSQPMTVGDWLGDTQPGVTIYYQYWFRDNAGPCGSGAAFSSGVAIPWGP